MELLREKLAALLTLATHRKENRANLIRSSIIEIQGIVRCVNMEIRDLQNEIIRLKNRTLWQRVRNK